MEKVFVLIGGFLFDFISDLIFFILHVTGSGSFPKPLSAKEEKEYLEKLNQGDQNARNTLIEHNLRFPAGLHRARDGPAGRKAADRRHAGGHRPLRRRLPPQARKLGAAARRHRVPRRHVPLSGRRL